MVVTDHAPVSAKEVIEGPLKAEVIRVIDGDTIHVRVQIWIDQRLETRVRLNGIDTPELRGKCDEEKVLAHKAKEAVINWVGENIIYLKDIQIGKFAGRVVADILLENNEDLKSKIIGAGLGRAYEGGKRQPWCS